MNRRGLLVAGMATVAVLSIPTLLAYDYVEHDPRFCTSCHLMDDAYGRWQASAHSKIECHACHVSSVSEDLGRLYLMVFDPKKKVEKHAEVDRSVCLACHESKGKERWRRVLETRGHAVHAEGDGRAQCVECHSESVHTFEPAADVCGKCHEEVRIHEKMDRLECLSCHDFLTEATRAAGLIPLPDDCRKCHVEGGERKAPVVPRGAVHGGLACARCHNPHAEEEAERRPGADCNACHRGSLARLAESASAKHRDCGSCHRAHDERGVVYQRCPECHQRHTVDPNATHQSRCQTCHVPHEFRAEPQDCAACHADVATTLYEESPKAHDGCGKCHQPHAAAPDYRACARCHRDKSKKVAVARPKKHQSCTSCHEPHGPKPDRAETCRRCHEDRVVGVRTSSVAEHGRCASCHRTVHGEPETGRRACSACHADKDRAMSAPRVPGEHTRCSACHPVHGKSLGADLARCADCHRAEAAGAAGDPHGTTCIKCHEPHGPPRATGQRCVRCHQDVRPKASVRARPHRDCTSCHEPHGGTGRIDGRCGACHEDRRASLVPWRAVSAHERCTDCHPGHEAKRVAACGTCHQIQAKKAENTKHADCRACHPPHDSKRVGGEAWRASCSRCHETIVRAVASRGPTHGTCGRCHRPHDVTPPSCDDCHAGIRRQLMHRVEEHQARCADCHHTHAAGAPTRATCTRCHDSRTDHYPEAKRCDACHPFGRTR